MTVSVVATLRNEEDSVAGFLDSLLSQSRLPDEIVLVDGGSEDRTVERAKAVAQQDGRVRVHVVPGANIARGRNVAITYARGDLIAVTDAGTVVDHRWLEELLRPLEADVLADVSSGFFDPGGTGLFERVLAAIITPHESEIDAATFLPSSRSVAFRRSAWERVGGYPEWLTHCEDLVFDLAMRKQGARFAFAPAARVSWNARSSLRSFFKQYYTYGRGDGQARLWPRRHFVRYATYLMSAAAVVMRPRRATGAAILLGALLYFSKYWRRSHMHLKGSRRLQACAALMVPPVVITGDVAKMAGYPVGVSQRAIGEAEPKPGE